MIRPDFGFLHRERTLVELHRLLVVTGLLRDFSQAAQQIDDIAAFAAWGALGRH